MDVIELSGFEITFNYDFRPKLHSTQFNFHYKCTMHSVC